MLVFLSLLCFTLVPSVAAKCVGRTEAGVSDCHIPYWVNGWKYGCVLADTASPPSLVCPLSVDQARLPLDNSWALCECDDCPAFKVTQNSGEYIKGDVWATNAPGKSCDWPIKNPYNKVSLYNKPISLFLLPKTIDADAIVELFDSTGTFFNNSADPEFLGAWTRDDKFDVRFTARNRSASAGARFKGSIYIGFCANGNGVMNVPEYDVKFAFLFLSSPTITTD